MKKLGIESWSNLPKEKFTTFFSMMPEMSDEVRLKIIEQMPQFNKLCIESLGAIKEFFEKMIDSNERITMALIKGIDSISEILSKELDKESLSTEERNNIIEKLMEIVKIYNEIHDRNKSFFDTAYGKVITGIGLFLGAALILVAGAAMAGRKPESFSSDSDEDF
jgi:hypothetical protein